VIAFAGAVGWGLVAVSAAFLARAIAITPLSFYFSKKYLGIDGRRVLKQCLSPCIALTAMGAIVLTISYLMVESSALVRLFAMIGGGAATYIGVLAWIDRSAIQDAMSLRKA
jgi:PST family polysaccharide transporter